MSEFVPIRTWLRGLIQRGLRIGEQAHPPNSQASSGHAPAATPNPSHAPSKSSGLTLAQSTTDVLNRLKSGEGYRGTAELLLGEALRQVLAAQIEVHDNPFSAKRQHDLLNPILQEIGLEGLQGANVVDLGCGSLNPFTSSFLLLGLGAERAYAIDPKPIEDTGVAIRALAVAAEWLMFEPTRIVDRPSFGPDEVLQNLRGFELAKLASGDAAGLASRRLIHRVEVLQAPSMRTGEADLVFSVSQLQRLERVDEAIAALRRITRPGGLGIHVIDFVDPLFYSGAAGPFEFLKIPFGEPLVHGSNRVRCDEFCELFARHGFSVERVNRWASVPPPTDQDREGFADPFRQMPLESLNTTGARIIVRREGVAAARTDKPRRQPEAVPFRQQSTHSAQSRADTPHLQIYQRLLGAAAGAERGDYVALDDSDRRPPHSLVKLIAFYLPQFHPIPENDDWWGRGFTEWANVSKAVPQFVGHYQPRLPGELGHYDLRVPEVQRRQVELACKYGVSAFCFYYYWFDGKRLLERPLTQFTSDPAIDFPFCLCWANENWTRTWDGHEDQVLVEQRHRVDSDARFIADIEPLLRHKNYLTIHGRPVLLVYRTRLLPDAAATSSRWRDYCRRVGLGDPYLVAVESFETVEPRAIGFDAAVEFPPNTAGWSLPEDITPALSLANPAFAGAVFRYRDMMRSKTERPSPPHALFKAVCPGFDNEPRRPGNGSVYAFSSPTTYARWLEHACRTTMAQPDREKRLVFINAWNEWAEGAYLEPDGRYGYAYLDATAKALEGLTCDWTILFVSHDACRGGAQAVLLDFLAWLKAHTAIRAKVICLEPGEWLPRFQRVADTMLLSEFRDKAARSLEPDLTNQLLDFCGTKPDLVYGNSIASGRGYPALEGLGVPVVTHVHELEASIRRYAGGWLDDVMTHSAHFVACSEPVKTNLVASHGLQPQRISTVHSWIPAGRSRLLDDEERGALRRRLGLAVDEHLVVACGIGMPFRKGADLFIEVGRALHRQGRRDIRLMWIGAFPEGEEDPRHGKWSRHVGMLSGQDAQHIAFSGVTDDPIPYLQAADLFVLPSREDPFPLVALEAASCGLPIVCFDAAGGMPAFVENDAGRIVPFEDVEAMASNVTGLLDDAPRRRELGARARQKVLSRYTSDAAAPHLLSTCRTVAGRAPAVSVIVPNYNHERFLSERLDTIFGQTFRDLEVIIVDDASTDGSLSVIEKYRGRADVRVLVNEWNSGSPFKQWLKGLDAARADVIWIAESDDACEPELVETLLAALRDPQVKLAYANSHVTDERSAKVGDYTSTAYLTSLSTSKWLNPYQVTAEQEVNDGLGVKNTILSASSVMFKRFALDEESRRVLESLTIAGDWYFFAHAMAGGEIYYTPRKLNHHRRHGESIVGKLLTGSRVEQFFREFFIVQSAIIEKYPLREGFEGRWEQYLREQWGDFFPGRAFSELNAYYPLDDARDRIAASVSRSTTRSR